MTPNQGAYLSAAREVISGNDRAMRTMATAYDNMRRYNERSDEEKRQYYDKMRQSSQIMAEKLMRSGLIR